MYMFLHLQFAATQPDIFVNSLPDNITFGEWERWNYISLNIVLDEQTPLLMTDKPSHDAISLLAQWCGALGFWMGLSAMTLFELVDVIINVVNRSSSTKVMNATA